MDIVKREWRTWILSWQTCQRNINNFEGRSSFQIQAYCQGLLLRRNPWANQVANLIEKFPSVVKPHTDWSGMSSSGSGMPLIFSTIFRGIISLSLGISQDLLIMKLPTLRWWSIWLICLPISIYRGVIPT